MTTPDFTDPFMKRKRTAEIEAFGTGCGNPARPDPLGMGLNRDPLYPAHKNGQFSIDRRNGIILISILKRQPRLTSDVCREPRCL